VPVSVFASSLFTCAPAMTWSDECTTNALATTSFSRFVAPSTWLRCLLRGAQASFTHTPKAITSAVLIMDPYALGVRSRGRVSSRHKQCLLLAPPVSPIIHLCSLFFLSAVARQVHTSTEDCTVWPTTLFRSVCGRVSIAATSTDEDCTVWPTTLFRSVCGRVSIAALANRRLPPEWHFFVCEGRGTTNAKHHHTLGA
jgi:hypothetical protein